MPSTGIQSVRIEKRWDRAAPQDEGREKVGYRPMLKVAPLPNEPGHRDRDREIGQADDGVRAGVQRHKAGRPAQTEAVSGQSRRVQKPIPDRQRLFLTCRTLDTRLRERAQTRSPAR